MTTCLHVELRQRTQPLREPAGVGPPGERAHFTDIACADQVRLRRLAVREDLFSPLVKTEEAL